MLPAPRNQYRSRPLYILCGVVSIIYFASFLTKSQTRLSLEQVRNFVSFQYDNSETVSLEPVDLEPVSNFKTNLDGEENNNGFGNLDTDDSWEVEDGNIPDILVEQNNRTGGPRQFNGSCALFPDLFTIQFSNSVWQVQKTENETYYLYAAYLDLRQSPGSSSLPATNATVRILAMIDADSLATQNATVKHCQFWFDNQRKPVFAYVTDVKLAWVRSWGRTPHYYPYLITCELPPEIEEAPASVSLVSSACDDATNNLKLVHRNRLQSETRIPKQSFGVCVKALDFHEGFMVSKLVEWIETLRLLGAEKIFMYEYFVDPVIKKVLRYYERQGFISLSQAMLPGELPNQPKLRHLYIHKKITDKRLTELIPYNDCLYKNMYDFKYLAVIDTDEIIMPTDDIQWKPLVDIINIEDIGAEKLAKGEITTYCFRNFYFMDNMTDINEDDEVSQIPGGFHMLQHIYRSQNHTKNGYMKCFHSTQHTLAVHNHLAFYCVHGKCRNHLVSVDRAQMNHYRESCVKDVRNCSLLYGNDPVRDTKIWRYKDELISSVNSVINQVSSET